MIFMKLSRLLQGIPVHKTSLARFDSDITGICEHATAALPGDLFVCIPGIHADGHVFAPEAASHGAKLILCERLTEQIRLLSETGKADYILTGSTRAAVSHLWSNWYGVPQSGMKIIAVTGTNGKTSVTHMLQTIYRAAGKKAALIGTITNTLTTPDPHDLFRILRKMHDGDTDTVIMEASSHALALRKLEALTPDIAIFTNLTPEHLDFHGSMEAYFRAKASLFQKAKTGIINLDDSYASELIRASSSDNRFYSACREDADFTAKNIRYQGCGGIQYECLTHNHLFRITSPIPGKFTVYNTLAAVSCAYTDGIRTDCIRYALKGLYGVPGRLERIPLNRQDFTVYLDFAHTPDALENVLRAIRCFMQAGQRLTVLFGCGGDRDRSKRPLMGAVAAQLADFLIVTSDNSRSEDPSDIIDEILTGIPASKPHTVILNRREAIEYAILSASGGDVILLAGKGHETYEINRAGKHPFSEREIVTEAVSKRKS